MKNVLRLEQVVFFLFSIFLFSQLDFRWWLFLALILTPDLSMLGYLAGTEIGAWSYNLFHHRGLALGVYLIGFWLAVPWVQLVGVILFGHSSMDRIFGYGLKYPDSFHHTHLGWLKPPETSKN